MVRPVSPFMTRTITRLPTTISAMSLPFGVGVPAGAPCTLMSWCSSRLSSACTPDSELVLFPEGGHLLPVEEADGICRALTSWLDRKLA